VQTKSIPLSWSTVSADSTTNSFLPFTGWMSNAGMSKVRSAFEIIGTIGDITVSPAYQIADHPDSPGVAVALLTTFDAGDDVYYPGSWKDVTGDVDDTMLIRFGFIVKNTSTSNVTTARVSGTMQVVYE